METFIDILDGIIGFSMVMVFLLSLFFYLSKKIKIVDTVKNKSVKDLGNLLVVCIIIFSVVIVVSRCVAVII